MSYQVPPLTTYLTLCGDLSDTFEETFSREKNAYIEYDGGESVVVDLAWGCDRYKNAQDYLSRWTSGKDRMFWNWDVLFLTAGYLDVGVFYEESYYLFYDLLSGEVLRIHQEAINEEAPVEMWEDSSVIRPFMDRAACQFCTDFNTFLRLACLGEPYNEDELVFVEEI